MSHAHDDLPPGEGLFSLNADLNQDIRIGKWSGILREFHPREGGHLEFVVECAHRIPHGPHACRIHGRREFHGEVMEVEVSGTGFRVVLRHRLTLGDDGSWSVEDGMAVPPLVC